jgi:OmpA-OmpF porin, OOP family
MKKQVRNNTIFICAFAFIGLGFSTACSSVKKADISKTANPTAEIQSLQEDVNIGYTQQLDVLAQEDFNKSLSYLDDAKEGLRKEKSQSSILDDVAYGRTYLNKATLTANQRRSKAEPILKARKAALDAGVRKHSELKDSFTKLDNQLRDEVGNNLKDLSAKGFSDLQAGYQKVELDTIKAAELGTARAQVTGARESDNASSKAPETLRQAELSLKNADNTIEANRYNPAAYRASVAKANVDAKLLMDVMTAIKNNSSDLKEQAALKIVKQNYEIARLNGAVEDSRDAVSAKEEALMAKEQDLKAMDNTLSEKDQMLNQAESTVALQTAIDNARTQFKPEEAQVFQQGNKLLIRLDSMAFPSGQSALPTKSLDLLAKVKSIAGELNPTNILVEGHTDSTGGAKLNQKLSQERATAVAKYFETAGMSEANIESMGYGFTKPVAPNNSAEGRRQNRRVDIVITPGPATAAM